MSDTKEQQYRFIDKTGSCFADYARIPDDTDYHKIVTTMLQNRLHSVGDMLVFRDELVNAGFKWGIDFYAVKT